MPRISISKNVREQIISTAEKLFAQYGYKKITMQDIADSMHKTKGSLYYYFKNKESIFLSIVENDLQILKKSLYEYIQNEETAEKKLRAYIINRQKGYKRLSSIYESLHKDIYMDAQLYKYIRNLYEKEEIATIKMILRKGMKSREFDLAVDVDIASKAIFATINGFSILSDNTKNTTNNVISGDETEAQTVGALLNILFYGIKKR